MADTLDKVLGISSALSGILSYVCYRLYKSRSETAAQVKNIPIWHADLDLYDRLSMVDNNCLAYAAVEGVVKETGRVIHSQYGQEAGVIRQSQMIEHKSKRVNGFWSDVKKELKNSSQTVPFAIVKGNGGDSKFRIEVTEASQASHISNELDITYDRFEPHKSSIVEVGLDRLFGEVTKGLQETEKMLLTGTSVLGVGKIFLDRGEIKIGPPSDASSGRTYILTKMRLSELVRSFESQSSTFRILSIVSAFVGGGILAYVVWRHIRQWLEKRKQRLQFEEIRRTMVQQQRNSESVGRAADGELRDEDTCVVCLGNPRQVVSLNCGHIAMCADCAEALPVPKKCPVCRSDIERFLPIFNA